jgi:uncharacterized protein
VQSCLYRGTVQHQRFAPVDHRFRYSISLAYLDLGELPHLVTRLFSRSRWGPCCFRRDRHLGEAGEPLDDSVRKLVEERTGWFPRGPIRLLTMLDNFGYYFSPLNLYYCWSEPTSDAPSGKLQAVVAEVNNMPWREQHVYVLWSGNETVSQRYEHDKEFHVSPFLEMDLRYRWSIPSPDEELSVGIEAIEGERRLFAAGMRLRRSPLTRPALRRSLWQFPWMAGQVVAAIYYQAFILWWKQCPVFTHPHVTARSPVPSPERSPKVRTLEFPRDSVPPC